MPEQPYKTEREKQLEAERDLAISKRTEMEGVVQTLRQQKATLYAVVDRALVDLSRVGLGALHVDLPPRDVP